MTNRLYYVNGNKRLYISNDGNAAVLVEEKRLMTAYPSSMFNEGMKEFVEEIKRYG